MTIPAFAHPRPPLPGLLDAAIVGLRECGLDSCVELLRAAVLAEYPREKMLKVVQLSLATVQGAAMKQLHELVTRYPWKVAPKAPEMLPLRRLDQTRELLEKVRDRLESR